MTVSKVGTVVCDWSTKNKQALPGTTTLTVAGLIAGRIAMCRQCLLPTCVRATAAWVTPGSAIRPRSTAPEQAPHVMPPTCSRATWSSSRSIGSNNTAEGSLSSPTGPRCSAACMYGFHKGGATPGSLASLAVVALVCAELQGHRMP
jgi:hypothetical protein